MLLQVGVYVDIVLLIVVLNGSCLEDRVGEGYFCLGCEQLEVGIWYVVG